MKVDKVEYKGWHNCYRVSNGEIEAIVTADVGPRIIRFGFVGGQNLFKEFAEQLWARPERPSSSCGAEVAYGKRPRIPSRPGLPTTCR